MAREIHDTIAQGLTGIVTQLEAAEQAPTGPSDWRRHVENADRPGPREPGRGAAVGARRCGPSRSRRPGCPTRSPTVAAQWSALNGVPVEVTTTGDVQPLHPEIEVGAAADGAGGAGQRRQARERHARRADPVLHGRRRDPRRPRRRRRASTSPTGPTSAAPGFGLTAMRQRVSRVAGTLAIESEPGGGTAVSARVPAIVAPGIGRPRRDARSGCSSSTTTRSSATASAACSPATRSSRSSARRPTAPRRSSSAGRLRPDVILMDLRMPGVNGAAAIRELAERGIPARVLVLTTYDSDSDVVPAIEAGATGYLLKDSPREELFRAVRAASRGESVLAPSVATRLMSQLRTPAPDALSDRELEVLSLIAQGETNRGAAARLFISRGDGQDAPAPHLREARRQRPRRRRRRPPSSAGCCRRAGTPDDHDPGDRPPGPGSSGRSTRRGNRRGSVESAPHG